MTAAHTPGPWTVAPTNSGLMIRSEAQPGYLAEIRYAKDERQHKANARLIAAAPALAEALRAIIEQHDSGASYIAGYDASHFIAALESARAALKQAGVE